MLDSSNLQCAASAEQAHDGDMGILLPAEMPQADPELLKAA
jgi:hypothetical protein